MEHLRSFASFGRLPRNAAILLVTILVSVCYGEDTEGQAQETASRTIDIVHVPSFDLPTSYFLDGKSRYAIRKHGELKARTELCLKQDRIDEQSISANRSCLREYYYLPLLQKLKQRYSVSIKPGMIAGVYIETITPADGISKQNHDRVLINVHGGAFMYGGRDGGQIESIPIASVGKIKVISVDYRMAPEHKFPAATEDIVAVYRSVLRTHSPRKVGIYGCSAGAVLTAQTLAQLQKSGLPIPGAVGMFGGGAHPFFGDAYHISQALLNRRSSSSDEERRYVTNPYSKNIETNDPRFFPGLSSQIMARFPASLLISSTRDLALSSALVTHAQLTRMGIPADLHVWEGVGHCFQFNPDLEASREAYDVIVRFFDSRLPG